MARNTDFIGFTFNGCHSSEFNIYSVSDGSRYQDNLVPNPIDYTEQVPGGVGQYYFGSDMDIKEFPLSIAYDNLSELQVRELRNWLAPDTVGELIFDERPYKTYTAKISTSPSLSFICFDKYNSSTGKKERVYKGEGSINFVCYYPLGVVSGEKKELKYYQDKINDEQFRNIGGEESTVKYKVDKEVAVVNKIYGKSKQTVTVQGKNLLDIERCKVFDYKEPPHGMEISLVGDTVHVDGVSTTTSASAAFNILEIGQPELQGKGYLISKHNVTGTTELKSIYGLRTADEDKIAIMCNFVKGQEYHFSLKVMVTSGNSTPTTYEPFVPNSPSPDYPAPISGAEPTKITICGKNLLNLADYNISYTDGVYKDKITGFQLQAGRTYTLSYNFFINNASNQVYGEIGYGITPVGGMTQFLFRINFPSEMSGQANLTFTAPVEADGKYLVLRQARTAQISSISVDISETQLEVGGEVTTYNSYLGSDYSLPILSTLYSIHDSVVDEYDAITGIETRKIMIKIFDGTENWELSEDKGDYLKRYFSLSTLTKGDASEYRLCSHFPNNLVSPSTAKIGFYVWKTYYAFRPDMSKFPDVASWKTWLAAQYNAGTPVTVIYKLAEPVITTKERMTLLDIETFSDLEESNLIINSDSEKINYFTNSNAGLSLRIYPQKYQNIDEWSLSSGLLQTLDTQNPTAGYDHYIILPDGSKGIQLYNPGDKETDFILSFNKPTPMNDIFFTLSNGEQFMLNLRSSDTDVEDYGAVSDVEKRVAAMTGGVITIDTKKNRIMYNYGTGENITEESIYFALKKGQFFKIPKNKTPTGGYNLVIGTTSNIETDSIKISYDYLYY